MIKFIRSTIADLAHAVARSELTRENARLATEQQETYRHNTKLLIELSDLRARLEAVTNELDHVRENYASAVKSAERRSPVDRSAAIDRDDAFQRVLGALYMVDLTEPDAKFGRLAAAAVDAILGAQKGQTGKLCGAEAARLVEEARATGPLKTQSLGCCVLPTGHTGKHKNKDGVEWRRFADNANEAPAEKPAAESAKRCASVSLEGNRCCKEVGHSGLCSTKSGGVLWDGDDLGAAPSQPAAFVPAETSEEPSAELVEQMATAGHRAFAVASGCPHLELRMETQGRQAKEKAAAAAIYTLIARDHAKLSRKLAEVIEAGHRAGWNGTDNSKLLPVFIEQLGEDHAAAVKRVGELEAENKRLSAPCPADGMSNKDLGDAIAFAGCLAGQSGSIFDRMGAKARELFTRAAK